MKDNADDEVDDNAEHLNFEDESESAILSEIEREEHQGVERPANMKNNASQEDHLDTPAKEGPPPVCVEEKESSVNDTGEGAATLTTEIKKSVHVETKATVAVISAAVKVNADFISVIYPPCQSFVRLNLGVCTDAGYDTQHLQSCSRRLKANISAFKPISAEENETEHN